MQVGTPGLCVGKFDGDCLQPLAFGWRSRKEKQPLVYVDEQRFRSPVSRDDLLLIVKFLFDDVGHHRGRHTADLEIERASDFNGQGHLQFRTYQASISETFASAATFGPL